jgi:hypothetical protein
MAGYGISLGADVRYASKNGHRAGRQSCPLCAISGLMHCSKQNLYSITSLAIFFISKRRATKNTRAG